MKYIGTTAQLPSGEIRCTRVNGRWRYSPTDLAGACGLTPQMQSYWIRKRGLGERHELGFRVVWTLSLAEIRELAWRGLATASRARMRKVVGELEAWEREQEVR